VSDIDHLLSGDRTRADSVSPSELARPTRTSQDELAAEVGHLRSKARLLSEDVAHTHQQALEVQLEARTDEAAKRSVGDLLQELADLGFSWREIARMIGVSIPALRKWRHGEGATGPNRRAIARLLAFVDVLQSDHLVQDVPSWLEMPLSTSTVTGLDIYALGRGDLLLMCAANHITSDTLLDAADPNWRQVVDDRFDVYTAGDGEHGIRLRSGIRPA
jgi:hypothetical protein